MSIDLSKENLKHLSAAANSIHWRPNTSTVWRWFKRGIRGIRLETILIGGRRYTSDEALDRFFTAITAAASGETPPARTPMQRSRAVADAERELREDGI
ncbi:MAG: DUF1580 domain-containing protein [Pirellulaceae bacterium]